MFLYKILLAISVLPAVILGIYIYKKDKEKEPTKLLVKLVIFGALSGVPALILELIFGLIFQAQDNYLFSLFECIVGVALIEELCKFFPAYLLGVKSEHFNDVYDAVIYTAFSTIGFATLENIIYTFSHGVGTGIMRMIFSVPGHLGYGILMGYFLGIAYKSKKIGNQSKYKRNLIYSILIPTLYHGLYDAVLTYGSGRAIFSLLFILLTDLAITFFAFVKAKKISEENEKLESGNIREDIGNILIVISILLMIFFGMFTFLESIVWSFI